MTVHFSDILHSFTLQVSWIKLLCFSMHREMNFGLNKCIHHEKTFDLLMPVIHIKFSIHEHSLTYLAKYPGSETISQIHSELSGYLLVPTPRGDRIVPCTPCSTPPHPAVCSTAVMLNPRSELCWSETNSINTWKKKHSSTHHVVFYHVKKFIHFELFKKYLGYSLYCRILFALKS